MTALNALVVGLAFLCSCTSTTGSKIFLHPFYNPSHVMELIYMGAEVVKRGDNVTIGLPVGFEKFSAMAEAKGIKVIYIARLDSAHWKDLPKFLAKSFEMKQSPLDFQLAWANSYCDDLDKNTLSNSDIMAKLESEKFDLIVSDDLNICRCNVLLPHMLRVPFVAVSGFVEETLSGMHIFPSVVPRQTSTLYFTPKMTFWQRILNLVDYIQYNTIDFPDDGRKLIEKHLPGSKKTYRQLLSKAEFWLFTTISAYLSPPLSAPPNVAFIGGLSSSPAKSLPYDLHIFCDQAKGGVIVMSFGSLPLVGADLYDKLFKAFVRLEQRVIVHVPNVESVPAMSDNVRTMSWIPQNDLLGHNNTVLFITHCGSKGQHEGLYHGVPMLGFPLIQSDQQFNGAQMAFKGFGLVLDIKRTTTEEIFDSIVKILTDPVYKARIQKASEAFHADPYQPLQKAADWISFISKHGGHHFRPSGMDMPFWQYYMLDIVALAVFSLHVLFVAIKLIVGIVVRYFNNGKRTNIDHKKKS